MIVFFIHFYSDEFKTLMGSVKGDRKRGYKHNILMNDFHTFQKQFEEYIDSFDVVTKQTFLLKSLNIIILIYSKLGHFFS